MAKCKALTGSAVKGLSNSYNNCNKDTRIANYKLVALIYILPAVNSCQSEYLQAKRFGYTGIAAANWRLIAVK